MQKLEKALSFPFFFYVEKRRNVPLLIKQKSKTYFGSFPPYNPVLETPPATK